jgi:cbb3-type cytochrome oxidase maturation protein
VELILVLLPFALLFAGVALALFVWAARSGQFDDLDTPAVRILFDDETPVPARGPAGPASPAAVGNGRAATSGPARGTGGPDKERP